MMQNGSDHRGAVATDELAVRCSPRPDPEVGAARGAPEIDLPGATAAAETFLRALGVCFDDESTIKSPRRMAEAYAALLTAREFEMTTFPNSENYDELVIVRSIPVQSGV